MPPPLMFFLLLPFSINTLTPFTDSSSLPSSFLPLFSLHSTSAARFSCPPSSSPSSLPIVPPLLLFPITFSTLLPPHLISPRNRLVSSSASHPSTNHLHPQPFYSSPTCTSESRPTVTFSPLQTPFFTHCNHPLSSLPPSSSIFALPLHHLPPP